MSQADNGQAAAQCHPARECATVQCRRGTGMIPGGDSSCTVQLRPPAGSLRGTSRQGGRHQPE
jgi:hypothetical protein